MPVGARPATVVFAHGALWVANLDDDTVSRIDPKARREVKRIPTGTAPIGLAGGRDAVWAIGGDGFVRRIDPFFNRVTRRIRTGRIGTVAGGGLMAGAVASTSEAVWVLSGGFLSAPRLYRVDPVEGAGHRGRHHGRRPDRDRGRLRRPLGHRPLREHRVAHRPPGVVAATIPVRHGASAVAVGEGAVWVASASTTSSSVSTRRRTRSRRRSTSAAIPVGVAVGAGAVWVANRDDGTVSRIDPETNEVVEANRSRVTSRGDRLRGRIGLGDEPGRRPAGGRAVRRHTPHRSSVDFETDPHANPEPQLAYVTCAKLLNHPDAPAPAGTRLVPEVAAALPARSADGRTFTFTIRKGFAFSPPLHEPVTAQTFVHSIERGTKLVAVPTRRSSSGSWPTSGQSAAHRRRGREGRRALHHAGSTGLRRVPRPARAAGLLRRAAERAARSERPEASVGRPVLRRRARARPPHRAQAQPELPRLAPEATPRDPRPDRRQLRRRSSTTSSPGARTTRTRSP